VSEQRVGARSGSLTVYGWVSRKGSAVSAGFTDEQRKGMLTAVHAREGSWGDVDPDTEITSIGSNIGLSEEKSYELFKRLVDEGYIDPGRVLRTGGAMPGRTIRVVGRGDNMIAIGDDVQLTGKGEAETR